MRRLAGSGLAVLLVLAACTSKTPAHRAANSEPSASASPTPAPRLIAFISSPYGFGPQGGPSAIEEIDEDGAHRRVIYRSQLGIGPLSWSARNQSFVFTLSGGEFGPAVGSIEGIWTVKADGSGAHKLSNSGVDPAWSPSGDLIAFAKPLGNPAFELHIMRADGTGERKLTSCAARCSHGGDAVPSWSPDGKRIVFQSDGNLFTIGSDGTGLRRVIACPGGCRGQTPSWSPDGKRIAFVASDSLWAVYPDGSTLRRLYSCRGRSCLGLAYPQWSPDGKTLLLTGSVGSFGQIITLTLNESIRTVTAPPTIACCGVWLTQRRHQIHP